MTGRFAENKTKGRKIFKLMVIFPYFFFKLGPVVLVYGALHIVELKKKQIEFLKSKLDEYLIDYIDITEYFEKEDWKKKFQYKLNEVIFKKNLVLIILK